LQRPQSLTDSDRDDFFDADSDDFEDETDDEFFDADAPGPSNLQRAKSAAITTAGILQAAAQLGITVVDAAGTVIEDAGTAILNNKEEIMEANRALYDLGLVVGEGAGRLGMAAGRMGLRAGSTLYEMGRDIYAARNPNNGEPEANGQPVPDMEQPAPNPPNPAVPAAGGEDEFPDTMDPEPDIEPAAPGEEFSRVTTRSGGVRNTEEGFYKE